MVLDEITSKLQNSIILEPVTPKSWKIKTGAQHLNGKEISIFLEQEGSKFLLTDKKETLMYMNELYDLKSSDVKMCIANVLRLYAISIQGGRMVLNLENLNNLNAKVFDFIMCISQLANMFAFFDKPE